MYYCRNLIYAVLVIVVTAISIAISVSDQPLSGGACTPIGSTRVDCNGQVWTCAKNVQTSKGYWYKGRP